MLSSISPVGAPKETIFCIKVYEHTSHLRAQNNLAEVRRFIQQLKNRHRLKRHGAERGWGAAFGPRPGRDGVSPLALVFVNVSLACSCTILPLKCVIISLDTTQVDSAVEHLTSYILLSRSKVHFFHWGKLR